MIKSIEKLIDIVDDYREKRELYLRQLKEYDANLEAGNITSQRYKELQDEAGKKMSVIANDFYNKYEEQYAKTLDITAEAVADSSVITDSKFINAVNTIRDNKNMFDYDRGIISSMIEPYRGNYGARLVLAKALDENTALGSAGYDINDINPYIELKNLDKRSVHEFGSWSSKFAPKVDLIQELDYVKDIAGGHVPDGKPSLQILF